MGFSGKLVFVLMLCLRSLSVSGTATMSITMKMNPASVKENDYYCTAATLPTETSYIVGFRPEVDASVAHHVLLFGCSGSYDASSHSSSEWSCKSVSSVCGPDSEFTLLYAWALDAEGFKMPEGVGLKVGSESNVQYVVLQMHFLSPPADEGSAPSLVLDVTMDPQPYVAGIFLLGAHAGEGLPPGQPNLSVEVACEFTDSRVIYPFAYRTHAHSLGTVISGYVIKTERDAKVYHLIGQKSPQAPQAFYPVEEEGLSVVKGDWLAAACYYNTTNEPGTTWFGPNANNEMCNFYIMYYKENDNFTLSDDECWLTPPDWVEFPASASNVPVQSSDKPHSNVHPEDDMNVHASPENEDTLNSWSKNNDTDKPTSSLVDDILNDLENGVGNGPDQSPSPPQAVTRPPDQVTSAPPDKTTSSTVGWQSTSQQSTLVLDNGWPLNGLSGDETKAVLGIALGQVSAVTVDSQGNVHVLHRGSHVWDEFSFDAYNVYQNVNDGPIPEPVVLKLSPAGTLLNSWGQDFFYLPHGLTVDSDGTYWITDVARHQVIKANPEETTVLTLGNEFKPGHGQYSFCKPAAMAVDKLAEVFYVADGYCNHRVVQYSMKGNYLHEFSAPVAGLNLFVPHSLALSSDGKQLFVADRENARIVRYDTSSGTGTVFSDSKQLGSAVYAVSFASTGRMAGTWPMCAVNGSMYGEKQARGFTMDESGIIKDIWGPLNGFTQPHDVAMSSSAVYVAEIQPNRIWKFIIVAKETPPTSPPTNNEATTASTSHGNTPHATDSNSPSLPTHPPPPQQESGPPTPSGNEVADDNVVSAASDEEEKHVNVVGIVLPLILLGLPIMVTLVIVGWCYVSRRYVSMKRSIRRRQKNPRKTLDQLLQPAHSGFTRIKTYDSDSEDNADVTIFQKTQNSYAIST